MRPVNLIPVEERQGGRRSMRSGPLPYIVFGALLLALGAVTLLVVTNNQISSRESELVEANNQTQHAEEIAQRLAPFVSFHQISASREETITNLANSRFDWQKVLAQLARVLPPEVTLTNLTGTVRPGISVGGGESIALRSGSPGPALSFAGCATDQEEVAKLLSGLKDIDGVTRVGLQDSSKGHEGGEAEGAVSAGGACPPGADSFQAAAVFDSAPIPVEASSSGEVAPEVAPTSEESTESSGEEASSSEGE